MRRAEPGERPRSQDDWRVLRAAADIERAARSAPTPSNRQLLAAARMALGEASAAVEILEDLAFQSPEDPGVRNDLAAAYLALFEQRGLSYPLPRALDLLLDVPAASRQPEGLFNLVLAASALGLVEQARSAWSDLCERRGCDGAVPPSLGPPQVAGEREQSDLGAAVTRFELEQIPRLADPRQCESAVAAARQFAATVRERHHERGYAGFISYIAGDCGAPRRAESDALARYSQARRAYEQRRYAEADLLLRDSVPPRHPYWRLLVRYQAGVLAYWRGDRQQAATTFASLRQEACGVESPYLCARSLWMSALLAATEGRPLRAADIYVQARSVFEGARDHLGAAAVSSSLSEVYDLLGESRLAWQERAAALRTLAKGGHPRLHNALLIAADASQREGLRYAAAAFAREAMTVAGRRGDSARRLEAAIALMRYEPDASANGVSGALDEEARRLGSPDLVERMRAELLAARGEGLTATDPEAAVANLDRAVGFFAGQHADGRQPPLLFLRARARLAQGRSELAAADLSLGLSILSRDAGSAEAPNASDLQRSDDALADLVALMNGATDEAERALLNVDRLRAEYGAADACLACLQRQLAAGEYAVLFHAGAGTLERFTVGRDAIQRRRVEVPKATLHWLAQRVFDELRGGETAGSAWDRLSDLLTAGIDRSAQRLWVIPPDGSAGRVPFAALWWTAGGRRVGETASVVVVDSLAGLSRLLESASPPGGPAIKAAVLGPSPAAGLPSATREASSVAAIYGTRPLIDPRRDAIAAALDSAGVVHVAGHFEPATTRASGGTFWFGGVDRVPVPIVSSSARRRPYLAVLSACSTADSAEPRAWVGGAAAELLQSGVRFVLASSWPVGDSTSAAFMVPFHQAFHDSRDPVASFTTTQRAALAAHGPQAAFAYQLYAAARRETETHDRRAR